jgi:hypothetical protein
MTERRSSLQILEEAFGAPVRIRFWVCPTEGHSDHTAPGADPTKPTVEWRAGVAYCLHPEPRCNRNSQDIVSVVSRLARRAVFDRIGRAGRAFVRVEAGESDTVAVWVRTAGDRAVVELAVVAAGYQVTIGPKPDRGVNMIVSVRAEVDG